MINNLFIYVGILIYLIKLNKIFNLHIKKKLGCSLFIFGRKKYMTRSGVRVKVINEISRRPLSFPDTTDLSFSLSGQMDFQIRSVLHLFVIFSLLFSLAKVHASLSSYISQHTYLQTNLCSI